MYTREGKVAHATFEALGARPAHGPSEAWPEGVDGAEVDVGAVHGESKLARGDAPITSNVVLWPQPAAIVMNEAAFDRLSEQQQEALRTAGAEVLDERSRAVRDLDAEHLHAVCRMGAEFAKATPSEVRGLDAAVQPVYRMIEKGSGNAAAVAEIRELKGDAEPDTLECGRTGEQSAGEGEAAALQGTFHTKLTEEELAQSPLLDDPGEVNDENWGELTLRLSGGKARYSQENDRARFDALAPTRLTVTSSSSSSTISARLGASAGRCTAEH